MSFRPAKMMYDLRKEGKANLDRRLVTDLGGTNMIYTVTCNPSLDYLISVKDFQLGKTNRMQSERLVPGGKGINVSMVLKHLGVESTALGFIAGFTGDELERRLNGLGLHCDFIRLSEGCSRINVKFKEYDGTEINGSGPAIAAADVKCLLKRLERLEEGDVLVLAGSIPESIPSSFYRDILAGLTGKGILTAVDATGDLLSRVLEYHPFLVKPNHHELGELFDTEIRTRDEAVPYAKKLRTMGAENVLVSMSGQGAVLAAGDGMIYQLPAPEGKLVNAVGAGDSMVAGFLAGWLDAKDYAHAFRMGVSAGSASAFSEGLASKDEIMRLYRSV